MKLTDESHDPEWMGGLLVWQWRKVMEGEGEGGGAVGITDKEKFDLVSPSRAYTNFTQD